jgi:hypothetical protein
MVKRIMFVKEVTDSSNINFLQLILNIEEFQNRYISCLLSIIYHLIACENVDFSEIRNVLLFVRTPFKTVLVLKLPQ